MQAIVLHISEDQRLFVCKKQAIYTSHDEGKSWTFLAQIDRALMFRLFEHSILISRLFRWGIQDAQYLADGSLVVIAKGGIYKCKSNESISHLTHKIIRGSRPLFLCSVKPNKLYWGEYFSNLGRTAVHVFHSEDNGDSFEPIFAFTAGKIRHIHGVFYDPYDRKLWLTTGDFDLESALWVTDLNFQYVEQVIGGTQQCRIVQPLFTERYVYFGTDTPQEQNYIYRLEKRSGQVECLQPVEGSVFYGCKVSNALFFSTVVEPSRVNTSRESCLWGTNDGETWKRINKFRKDRWSLKYFQYGQIRFPSGENTTSKLWFTTIATQYDHILHCLDLGQLF